ncbi:MAG: archaeosine biosynthesis radical SAM protein RaSEA [Candidatus Kariarchaeaceae archaeon]|jgi:radical SAM enzyme (TIGR01210 family)
MRADPSKKKIFTKELYTLRVLSNQQRKDETTRMINWVDEYSSTDGNRRKALVFVLPTKGCKYALGKHGGCSMCTLPMDNPMNPSEESISSLPERTWEIFQKKGGMEEFNGVKFYTSGSFLDRWELPIPVRNGLLNKFKMLEEITIETRCEFVTEKNIDLLIENVPKEKLVVAIGQETTDDEINQRSINKGHTKKQFRRAVELLHLKGIQVKGYILLKPLFMSESSALEDAIRSATYMKELRIQNISINPAYIGKATLMEALFNEGVYQPPWLWSVYFTTLNLKKLMGNEGRIISDPVAAGSERGPRNCGRCDKRFKEGLKEFSATQEISILEELYCDCLDLYQSTLVTEHLSSGMGISKYF